MYSVLSISQVPKRRSAMTPEELVLLGIFRNCFYSTLLSMY